MDYHRKLRFKHPNLASLGLETTRRHRLPRSVNPSPRQSCESGNATEVEARFRAAAKGHPNQVPCQPSEEHISAQVKQLQFWLKVFARFCQDEKEHD